MASASETASEKRSLRRLGVGVLAIGAVWLLVMLYAIHAALPSNALELAGGRQLLWKAVLPEGWAFFSRNARQKDPMAYLRAADGTWSPVGQWPHAHPRFALGLDRRPRTIGVETAMVVQQAQDAVRVECREDLAPCLEKTPVAATVHNESPRPQLCGEVGIVFGQAVPWAWSQSNQDKPIHMPARFLRLQVTCSSN